MKKCTLLLLASLCVTTNIATADDPAAQPNLPLVNKLILRVIQSAEKAKTPDHTEGTVYRRNGNLPAPQQPIIRQQIPMSHILIR